MIESACRTAIACACLPAVQGSPVAALLDSVPADATRRSEYDVLVVHATGGGLPTA